MPCQRCKGQSVQNCTFLKTVLNNFFIYQIFQMKYIGFIYRKYKGNRKLLLNVFLLKGIKVTQQPLCCRNQNKRRVGRLPVLPEEKSTASRKALFVLQSFEIHFHHMTKQKSLRNSQEKTSSKGILIVTKVRIFEPHHTLQK